MNVLLEFHLVLHLLIAQTLLEASSAPHAQLDTMELVMLLLEDVLMLMNV